jgi:hypothetical protein
MSVALTPGQTPVFRVTGVDRSGRLTWTNAPVPGICSVETAVALNGSWAPGPNAFATNSAGELIVPVPGSNTFHRLRAVEISATAQGFTNLISAYGLLETIAGNGAGQDEVNYWQSWYEGWPGSWAPLSRPHFAMADRAGNVFIADKNSHSVLRVDANGAISTCAGTHEAGLNGEGPTNATSLQLNCPNSLWVRADGVVYVLDTDNGRVRRVNTNGIAATLFLATSDGSALNGGRGLWVSDDESLAYFCAETRMRKWTPSAGLKTLATGFTELGNLFVEAGGDVLVCDRGAHYVYRVSPAGTKTVIAGNGTPTGGGEGYPALSTGFTGPRGIWPVPTGGYLLLTHDGCQLWYMDAAGIVHLLLNGAGGQTHDGDGLFFYDNSVLKISEGRSVTMDHIGNILICESDYGYVRRIRFQRMTPGN